MQLPFPSGKSLQPTIANITEPFKQFLSNYKDIIQITPVIVRNEDKSYSKSPSEVRVSIKTDTPEQINLLRLLFLLASDCEDEVYPVIFDVMECYKNNINMIKIESRPSKDEPWQYLLYVDFEGNIENEDVKKGFQNHRMWGRKVRNILFFNNVFQFI